MHFRAWLEICDLQLSWYKKEKKRKNILKSTTKTQPFKLDFVHQNLFMSLGKQVCEEHYHQCAGSSPEFCFCIYAGLPSPGQLSPAEGFLGTQRAAGFMFMVPSFHVELPSHAWGTPGHCCCFRLTGIKGTFF